MRISTRMLLGLNTLFRRPNIPECPTPADYALWEYSETRAQLEALVSLGFRADRGGQLLDLGCGLGGKTVYLAEHTGFRVLGIDISGANVREARAFAASRGTAAHFSEASAMSLPTASGSLDAIIATDAFEHFAEPGGALREAARVLKPGGQLGVSFGPFGSPLGSHLYDRIFIPWCHLLASSNTLGEALEVMAVRRARGLGPVREAAEVAAAREQIRYYNEDVNRMTLRRFFRLVADTPVLEVVAWRKRAPRKLRPLQPLIAVPGLDEVLTGMFTMVLRKAS